MRYQLALAALLGGCVTAETPVAAPPPVVEPAAAPAPPEAPEAAPAAAARFWLPEWSDHVAAAIRAHSRELLDPARVPLQEVATLCPGFAAASDDERAAFWALFLAAVTRYESGFDPAARMQEAWKDPDTGAPQYSEGLLQLSYSDRRGHPDCALDRARGNIVDPEVNLSCGVAILRRQLAVRRTLFPKPKPYYWAVLTSPKTRTKVVRHVEDQRGQLAFCVR